MEMKHDTLLLHLFSSGSPETQEPRNPNPGEPQGVHGTALSFVDTSLATGVMWEHLKPPFLIMKEVFRHKF